MEQENQRLREALERILEDMVLHQGSFMVHKNVMLFAKQALEKGDDT